LITGANRGIGYALAKAVASRGAHLHVQMRNQSDTIVAELKKAGALSVKVWLVDLGKREQIEQWAKELEKEKIDILVNNAGHLTGGLLEAQPLDDIYSMFQVNLLALVHLTRALIPGMVTRARGKIVNNSSVSAVMHFPCASTYAASKAAGLAFTNCLRLELARTGVSTLCLITPGIQTRMFKEIENKYGENIEVPKDSISPEAYAEKICEAILDDRPNLEPSGTTGIGLAVAKFLPGIFRREAIRRFKR
jgi:short-subunit dehydrogenase